MSQPSNPQPVFERISFVKPCLYCGARLAVFVSREAGSSEEHCYDCPECGKDYTVHAALEPLVSRAPTARTTATWKHFFRESFSA
jgi:uncharacterized protein with PIN domain